MGIFTVNVLFLLELVEICIELYQYIITTPANAQCIPPTDAKGAGSRVACAQRAAGYTCTKPACATSSPGKMFCTKETSTCRMCKDWNLYCKPPLL